MDSSSEREGSGEGPESISQVQVFDTSSGGRPAEVKTLVACAAAAFGSRCFINLRKRAEAAAVSDAGGARALSKISSTFSVGSARINAS